MPSVTSKSIQRGIRIPTIKDQYMQWKADNNPQNRQRALSAEINILIDVDFELHKKAFMRWLKGKK